MASKRKPKEYTITISTSSRFLDKLPYIKRKIESVKEGTLGPVRYHVLMPEIKKFKSLEEISVKDLQYYFLEQNFRNIEKSDALYIYNGFDKKLQEWYLGANSLLMMGKAFNKGIPIFITCLNENRYNQPYIEDIEIMHPYDIGTTYKYLDIIISKCHNEVVTRDKNPLKFKYYGHNFSCDPRTKLYCKHC